MGSGDDAAFGFPGSTAQVLEELKHLDGQVDLAAELAELKPIFYRLEWISRQYPTDFEIQLQVGQVKQHLLAAGNRLMAKTPGSATGTSPAPPAPVFSSASMPSAPAAPAPPGSPPPASLEATLPMLETPGGPYSTPTSMPAVAPPPEPQPAFAPPPPAPVSGPFEASSPFGAPPAPPMPGAFEAPPVYEPAPLPPPEEPPPPPATSWKWAVLGGALIGILLFGGLIVGSRYLLKRQAGGEKGETQALVSAEFTTTPPGALIRLDGRERCKSNCRTDLAPGTYQVQAILDGFEPAAGSLTVSAGAPASLRLTLVPLPLSLRLFTDLEAGQVLLDDKPAGDLQEGQLTIDRLSAGKHTIKVSGKAGEASFSFEATASGAATVSGPITTRNLLAILVSNQGPSTRLHSSSPGQAVSVDGKPAGQAGPEGLELPNLQPGERELSLGEGREQRKLVITVSQAPVLTAFLKLDINAGSLLITTGEDDVTVFLNGKEFRRKTTRGQVRVPFLNVRDYTVRVFKDGFLDEPEQRVQIKKGEEARLEFRLRPRPRLANLTIRGLAPGTQVLIDQQPAGAAQADGSFSSANIPPGQHTIELRRDKFNPKRITRQFRAGETVEVGGAEVSLERLLATLRLNVTPTEARVTIRRTDEMQTRPVRETTLRLPEGTYYITGVAPNHSERSVNVTLAAGESKNVDLVLTREKVAPPPVRTSGMSDWENPGAWQPQADFLVHKGGNYVLFRPTPLNGTFHFTAALRRGGRLRWFVNYRDQRNHALFEIDKKNFYRKDVASGRTTELSKVQHSVGQDNVYTLQIEITPDSVVHRIRRDGQWMVLDSWVQSGRGFNTGKFGFYIPGSDQVGLKDFNFTFK